MNSNTPARIAHLATAKTREFLLPVRRRLMDLTGRGCKPTKIIFELTHQCCLKCQMCEHWRDEWKNELTAEEWIVLIGELKDWLGTYRLNVLGGEPFMKKGIWDILEYGSSLDIPVNLTTNGFALKPSQWPQLLDYSILQLIVSLDGITPEVHEKVRGVPGAFERIWGFINYLGQQERPFLLGTNTVIMHDNILQLGEIARRVHEVGVNRISFNPVQATAESGTVKHPDWPYNDPVWPNPEDVDVGLDELIAVKAEGIPVITTFDRLEQYKKYFKEGQNWIRPVPCTMGYDTIFIDRFGNMRQCVPFLPNKGNLKQQSPAEFWHSEEAQKERQRMLTCPIPCMCTNNNFTQRTVFKLGLELFGL